MGTQTVLLLDMEKGTAIFFFFLPKPLTNDAPIWLFPFQYQQQYLGLCIVASTWYGSNNIVELINSILYLTIWQRLKESDFT